jgi:hypothetical protein
MGPLALPRVPRAEVAPCTPTNKMEGEFKDLQFKHPFTAIVCGPTGTGKSIIVRHILENWKILINTNLTKFKVLWFYGIQQPLYNEKLNNVDIIYINGKPTENDIKKHSPNCIVIDDLMEESKNDESLGKLFTRGSHHLGISVFFIVQNLFLKGDQMQTISLNSQYFIFTKTKKGLSQICLFGRQNFPGKSKEFLSIYLDATKKPYSYLVYDAHVTTDDNLNFRSRIIPEELPQNLVKYKFAPFVYELI